MWNSIFDRGKLRKSNSDKQEAIKPDEISNWLLRACAEESSEPKLIAFEVTESKQAPRICLSISLTPSLIMGTSPKGVTTPEVFPALTVEAFFQYVPFFACTPSPILIHPIDSFHLWSALASISLSPAPVFYQKQFERGNSSRSGHDEWNFLILQGKECCNVLCTNTSTESATGEL